MHEVFALSVNCTPRRAHTMLARGTKRPQRFNDGAPARPVAALKKVRPRARRAGKPAYCNFRRLCALRSRPRSHFFAGARSQEVHRHSCGADARAGRSGRCAPRCAGWCQRHSLHAAYAQARRTDRCAGPGPLRPCAWRCGRERPRAALQRLKSAGLVNACPLFAGRRGARRR